MSAYKNCMFARMIRFFILHIINKNQTPQARGFKYISHFLVAKAVSIISASFDSESHRVTVPTLVLLPQLSLYFSSKAETLLKC